MTADSGSNFTPRAERRAFSMVEVMFSVVLVSILVVAGLRVLGATAKARLVQRDQARAASLARDLLTEIIQQPYLDPTADTGAIGMESGESSSPRSGLDDVDDYHNLSESPPKAKDGTTIAGYTGWTRKVEVRWITPLTFAEANTDTGLKRIKVTVTGPGGLVTNMYGLRSNRSPYETQPTNTTTYTSWIGVTLQPTSDTSTKLTGGASPLNQIP